MRTAIIAAILACSSLAHAGVNADIDLTQPVEPNDPNRWGEISAVTGVLAPGGGVFIEERMCEVKRSRYIGCMQMLFGKQEGGTKKGNNVFDLYASSGYIFRRGRFDVTPMIGASTLTTTIFVGLLLATPWTKELPDPRVAYSLCPFEVTGNVAAGYTFVHKGRFRARAELGLRGHVPLFTDSRFELPNPHGIGATFGIGAGY